VLYDTEARMLIARERAALLRAEATVGVGEQRARRWLSDRLIAVGLKLAPECAPPRQQVPGARATTPASLSLREL
jgi:hypothetical protein